LDKDVDQSALDAVKQWRFQPAKKDGKAVAVRITIEIQFRDM
jgi:protein TonB